jgi:hypothetical protein
MWIKEGGTSRELRLFKLYSSNIMLLSELTLLRSNQVFVSPFSVTHGYCNLKHVMYFRETPIKYGT